MVNSDIFVMSLRSPCVKWPCLFSKAVLPIPMPFNSCSISFHHSTSHTPPTTRNLIPHHQTLSNTTAKSQHSSAILWGLLMGFECVEYVAKYRMISGGISMLLVKGHLKIPVLLYVQQSKSRISVVGNQNKFCSNCQKGPRGSNIGLAHNDPALT